MSSNTVSLISFSVETFQCAYCCQIHSNQFCIKLCQDGRIYCLSYFCFSLDVGLVSTCRLLKNTDQNLERQNEDQTYLRQLQLLIKRLACELTLPTPTLSDQEIEMLQSFRLVNAKYFPILPKTPYEEKYIPLSVKCGIKMKHIYFRWKIVERYCPDHLGYIENYISALKTVADVNWTDGELLHPDFAILETIPDPEVRKTKIGIWRNCMRSILMNSLERLKDKYMYERRNSILTRYRSLISLAKPNENACHINLFSNDIWDHIFSFVEVANCLISRRVCKLFKHVIETGRTCLDTVTITRKNEYLWLGVLQTLLF